MDKDVKETNEQNVTEESSPSQESNAIDELAEILGESQEQSIPYSRFKQVINERNALKEKVSQHEQTVEAQIQEAVQKAKLEAMLSDANKSEDDYSFEEVYSPKPSAEVEKLQSVIDELKNEINSIKVEKSNENLVNSIKKAKSSFEYMNESEVLAWKKLYPKYDIEQLAEHSHKKNLEFIKSKYQAYIDKKKNDSEAVISGPELVKSLKGGNPNFDLKEANQLVKKYMQGVKGD